MDGDGHDDQVEKLFVQGREPIARGALHIAVQRPRLEHLVVGEQAEDRLGEQQTEQCEDHQRTERVMTGHRRSRSAALSAQVGEDRAGSAHEVLETRISGADEAPDDTRGHEQQHRVTEARVPGKPVPLEFTGDPSTEHRQSQSPVHQSDRQIPDPPLCRRPLDLHVHPPEIVRWLYSMK